MNEPESSFPPAAPENNDDKLSVVQPNSQIGSTFDKRYEILSLLGSGASGVIYKARDILLERDVAIKIIHSFLLSSTEAIERFKKEAFTSTSLSHSNIARVYNQGIAADGRLYMVMDCLEGESLAQMIARAGKLELEVFFDLFLQIIDALKYAHGQGVVHRDIKPSNILLISEDGNKKAMLLDFGIAKWIDRSNNQQITQTAAIVGSSVYMSPEQCLDSSKVDSRSDIYSLGCVMLESISGQPPFKGDSTMDVMYKHLHESVGKLGFLKNLPESMSRLIEKCLQKDPSQRYQTMQELKTDFDKCSDMRDTLKRRWQKQTKEKRSGKKSPVIILSLLAVLAIAAGTAYMIYKGKDQNEQLALHKSKLERDLGIPDPKRVPYASRELDALIDQYHKKWGLLSVLKVLKSWEKKHGTDYADLPNRADVLSNFVTVYVQLKDQKQAEFYANEVLACKQGRPSARVATELAQLFCENNQAAKGIVVLDKVFKEFPDSFPEDTISLLAYKARCLMLLGDDMQAVGLLTQAHQKVLALDISRRTAWGDDWRFLLIEALLKTGKKGQAEAIAQECIKSADLVTVKQKDAAALTYERLSKTCLESNAVEEGIKYYQLASSSFLRVGRPDQANQIDLRMAAFYAESKQFSKALEIYKRILSRQHLWYQRVSTLYTISSAAADNGKGSMSAAADYGKQALDACDAQLKLDKGDLCEAADSQYVNALQRMRDQLSYQGNLLAAEKLMDDWISKVAARAESSTTLASFLYLKGGLLASHQQDKEALVCANRAITILLSPSVQQKCRQHGVDPGQSLSQAYLLKSLILENNNKPEEAAAEAKKALALQSQPSYAKLDALLHIGRNLSALGKTEEAKSYLAQFEPIYRQAFPSWSLNATMFLRQLALDQSAAHEYAKAETVLTECVDGLRSHFGAKCEQMPELLFDLGQSRLMQQKYSAALLSFKEAESLLRQSGKSDSPLYSRVSLKISETLNAAQKVAETAGVKDAQTAGVEARLKKPE